MRSGYKLLLLFIICVCLAPGITFAEILNPSPPKDPVKLIFIHHSTGENWLADNNGRLGIELSKNNYFISDTNYGWGPNDIGDRTDIINWPEWFVGKKSKKYLKALYKSFDKNSSYTRSLKDPGGDNRIIMFKSCFPNSELEGRPNDKPKRGNNLTISNAKAIYIDLLKYFATKPDKLFIAVTAPPVLDKSLSKNARAFNNWLLQDWLKNYKGTNVAVFDFYNILTGPENHHRFKNKKIEHTYIKGKNTLYYPTGSDEHPSVKGNRKATKEFISLVNIFYNKWKTNQKYISPSTQMLNKKSDTKNEKISSKQKPVKSKIKPKYKQTIKPVGSIIDNFETANENEWVLFSDENNSKTKISFNIKKANFFKGKAGLEIKYNIGHDSWATCSLIYPESQDWTGKNGISLLLRAERTDQEIAIVAYQGDSSDDLSHFEYYVVTDKKAVKKWQRFDLMWKQLKQPEWEGDGSAKFNPRRAMGIAFVFSESSGKIWVDDISFLK